MCDASAGEGEADGCAMGGEEVFEFVVGDEGRGGAVDVDCEAGEDLGGFFFGFFLL